MAVVANPRRMKRSPGRSGTASPSMWKRAKPTLPGISRSVPIGATRARRSAVPARNSTAVGPSDSGATSSQ